MGFGKGLTAGSLAVDSYGGGVGLSTDSVNVYASTTIDASAIGEAEMTSGSATVSVGADTSVKSGGGITIGSTTASVTADTSFELTAGQTMGMLTDAYKLDSLTSARARTTDASMYAENDVSVSAKGTVGVSTDNLAVSTGAGVSVSGVEAVGVLTSEDTSANAERNVALFAGVDTTLTSATVALDAPTSVNSVTADMNLLAGDTAEVTTSKVGLRMTSAVAGSEEATLSSAGDVTVSAAAATSVTSSDVSVIAGDSVTVSSGASMSVLTDALTTQVASDAVMKTSTLALSAEDSVDLFAGSSVGVRTTDATVDVYDDMVVSSADQMTATATDSQVRAKDTATVSASHIEARRATVPTGCFNRILVP